MRIDKNRVIRTLIQSASGAGIALITAVTSDYSRESIATAVVGFISTVAIAVLMNIKAQTEDGENE